MKMVSPVPNQTVVDRDCNVRFLSFVDDTVLW